MNYINIKPCFKKDTQGSGQKERERESEKKETNIVREGHIQGQK
jgi:hypothetical protein